MNVCTKSINVDIFQSGPKWWTDQQQTEIAILETHNFKQTKNKVHKKHMKANLKV